MSSAGACLCGTLQTKGQQSTQFHTTRYSHGNKFSKFSNNSAFKHKHSLTHSLKHTDTHTCTYTQSNVWSNHLCIGFAARFKAASEHGVGVSRCASAFQLIAKWLFAEFGALIANQIKSIREFNKYLHLVYAYAYHRYIHTYTTYTSCTKQTQEENYKFSITEIFSIDSFKQHFASVFFLLYLLFDTDIYTNSYLKLGD